MSFQRVFSGAPWESQVGYCRALRAGPHVHVTGTAPVADDGSCFAPGDPQAQLARCLEIALAALAALAALNAGPHQVVRTRMFVTDIAQWPAFGRAHAAVFGEDPPCTTMVQVSQLIDPAMLVEIEIDAYAPEIP